MDLFTYTSDTHVPPPPSNHYTLISMLTEINKKDPTVYQPIVFSIILDARFVQSAKGF